LFVTSIFPGLINWLAGGLLLLALVNILEACFPRPENVSLSEVDSFMLKENSK
jgi:hypothetical protein